MKHKRIEKNKSWALIPIIVIVLILVSVWVYFTCNLFFTENNRIMTKSSGNSPTKTDKAAGYIESETNKAVTGSMAVVSDAGAAEWLKVSSNTKLQKVTNLSKDGLTIYRINNPQILKTTTVLQQPLMRMADMIAQYPDTIIMNGSAFAMGGTNEVVGLQINNGKLIRDWNDTSSGMQYAFIINKDGSCQIYDSTIPASTIIENGGQQSFDFGTAIIRDGKIQPSDGSVDWKIHSFIANDNENNLYVILSDTNAGYENIMAEVSSLNLQNMLLLDSGGSSQLSLNGTIIVPSQDDRAIPDYIVIK